MTDQLYRVQFDPTYKPVVVGESHSKKSRFNLRFIVVNIRPKLFISITNISLLRQNPYIIRTILTIDNNSNVITVLWFVPVS